MKFLLRSVALGGLIARAGRHARIFPGGGRRQGRHLLEVDDIRAGMKGIGRTVMKGTKIETLRRRGAGRPQEHQPRPRHGPVPAVGPEPRQDRRHRRHERQPGLHRRQAARRRRLCLAVRQGADRRHHAVRARCTASSTRTSAATWPSKDKPARVGLRQPLQHRRPGRSTPSPSRSDFSDPQPTAADGLWLVPLRTPLAATGMSPHSLALLQRQLRAARPGADAGRRRRRATSPTRNATSPLQAGGAAVRRDDHRRLRPVRHRHRHAHRGQARLRLGPSVHRLGGCEFPLMTGYIHTIYPRQSLSFKMGSPLRTVGVINADVSTCIAGWLDRAARHAAGHDDRPARARRPGPHLQRPGRAATACSGPLVHAALTNSVDMEGDLPEEMTARVKVRIDIEGRDSIVTDRRLRGPELLRFGGPRGDVRAGEPALAASRATTPSRACASPRSRQPRRFAPNGAPPISRAPSSRATAWPPAKTCGRRCSCGPTKARGRR